MGNMTDYEREMLNTNAHALSLLTEVINELALELHRRDSQAVGNLINTYRTKYADHQKLLLASSAKPEAADAFDSAVSVVDHFFQDAESFIKSKG